MWPVLPSFVPAPSPGLDMMDTTFITVWFIVSAIVVFGGFALLLFRLSQGRPEPRGLRCPSLRARAVVVVHRRRDGVVDDVLYCSHWSSGRGGACDHACLSRAA